MYLQTPGFILKSHKWREVDRVYTLFTEKIGKLEIQARGVRKIKSKLRGHLQSFALVDFNLVRGKIRHQLIGAQLVTSYGLPVTSYSVGYGYYFLELADKLTRENQPSVRVFKLLQEVLQQLEKKQSEVALKKLRVAYLLKMLKATGFNPEKRVDRQLEVQEALERYLSLPFSEIVASKSNGEPVKARQLANGAGLKKLFNISQYTLNEVIEQPMQTVKFLQSL